MNDLVKLLESVGKIQGFESGYVYEDTIVPRVTAIISKCTSNDRLMYWANNLGFKHKSFEKERNHAATIGTICHENIDAFLENNNHEFPDTAMIEARNAYNSFQKWFSDIFLLADVSVVFHEKTLVCKYFGGTLDGLYNINGRLYLIDYKTSNHINYNYCLQLAAYRYMLFNELGIKIDGCIILQLSKKCTAYTEYVLNLDNPKHLEFMEQCERTFLSLVYSYYNIINIEESYKNLDWEVK